MKTIGGPRLTAKDLGYREREAPADPPTQPLVDAAELRVLATIAGVAIAIAATAFSAGILAGLAHLGYSIASGGF